MNRVLSDWVWDPLTMRALAAGTAVLLWWRRERRLALWVVGTSVLAVLLQQGLKALVGRERPQWPDPVDWARYAAFPSGHAMTATVTCGLLLWVLALHWRNEWRGWGALAGAAAVSVLGVGWTRAYLGVHWPRTSSGLAPRLVLRGRGDPRVPPERAARDTGRARDRWRGRRERKGGER